MPCYPNCEGLSLMDTGAAAPDVDVLLRTLWHCAVFLDHREVLSEIEINPLMVLERGKGVRAIDIRPVWKNN